MKDQVISIAFWETVFHAMCPGCGRTSKEIILEIRILEYLLGIHTAYCISSRAE